MSGRVIEGSSLLRWARAKNGSTAQLTRYETRRPFRRLAETSWTGLFFFGAQISAAMIAPARWRIAGEQEF